MRQKIVVVLAVAVAFAAAPSGAEDKAENPLAPLAAIGKRLEEIAAKIPEGDLAAAAGSWTLEKADRLEKVRKELKDAGATHVTPMGFELELFLYKEKKPVYQIRSFVHADAKEPRFVFLDGREMTEALVKAHPLDAFKGDSSPGRSSSPRTGRWSSPSRG